MNLLRIFLLAALIFAFFGINNVEAEESNLTFVGNYDNIRATHLTISGNYAYIADFNGGFNITGTSIPSFGANASINPICGRLA